MLFTKLLQRVPKFSFGYQRTRPFLPVTPLYPEPVEKPVYRPLYERSVKTIIPAKQAYNIKMQAIVKRAKAAIKARQSVVTKKNRFARKKDKQPNKEMVNFVENMLFDDETGAPVGFGFDHLIRAVKAKGEQRGQSQYFKNLEKIIKKLNLMDEVELADLNKHFLSKKFKGDFYQSARVKLLNNLVDQLKKYKDENKIDELLNAHLDLSKQSKEFALSSIKEGKDDQLQNLLREDLVDTTAQKLALYDIDSKVKEYKQLKRSSEKQIEENPITKSMRFDNYFQENVTQSEDSDLEHIIGERFDRVPRGDVGFQTKEGIVLQNTANLAKRNYFRNKLDYVKEKNPFYAQETNQSQNQTLNDYIDINEEEYEIQKEINSINEDYSEKPTFEEIYERIDFFLKEAPEFIKSVCGNIKEAENKGYYPRILHTELKQRDLLWDEFTYNFQTVFPMLNENERREKLQVSQDENIIKQEQEYAIELYKQMSLPQNQEFFRHYLVDSVRYQTRAHDQFIQQFTEGLIPASLKEDYVKFMTYQDDDIMEQESEDDDPTFVPNPEPPADLFFQQFQEAANLNFYGRGKRKSCRACARIQRGCGEVTVNGKSVLDYFRVPYYRRLAMLPIDFSGVACYINVEIWVRGSGVSSQADAVSVALSRAIISMLPVLKSYYRKHNMTKTDRREVERKKTGLLKARKKWPYNRR